MIKKRMLVAAIGGMMLQMLACSRNTAAPVQTPSARPASVGESVVQKAKDDLARRIAVPADRIKLVEATEVEWSDSSLDCPQPGMAYLQVITPGYRIVLESGGNRYEYHSNRESYVVYCESAVPQIPSHPVK